MRSAATRLLSLAAIAATASCAEPSRPSAPSHRPSPALASAAPRASAEVSAAPAAPAASSSAAAAAPTRVTVEAGAMGTHVLLAAYTTDRLDEAAIRPKLDRALDEIRRLETVMTTWRPDAELSRVNAAAGRSAVPVSPETLDVVKKSLWVSKLSGGVFDVTFEAMHGLWKFDEDLEPVVPPSDAIERARKLIDYRKIRIDEKKHTLRLDRPGMRMSLGGIAKGYAVDAAARVLEAEGLTAFFVQAGGDLYVRGKKPDGTPWRVGARDPRGRGPDDYFAFVEVEDHAFSTAGDYERSFVKDGVRYHHILDPRTGRPATASRSVTIWAKDAFTADAIDDAVFILGPEKGIALVDSIEDAGALIVDAQNKVRISKRLQGKVQILRQPTDGL